MEIDLLLQMTKKIRVLYVEDDDNLRESTASLFENFFKEVTTAIDGVDGLEKYRDADAANEPYDLIISDIDMPRLNGIEMSREILKDKSSMHIVFITAHDEKKYLQDTEELGVKNLITKPINFDKLCESIYEVCESICSENKDFV